MLLPGSRVKHKRGRHKRGRNNRRRCARTTETSSTSSRGTLGRTPAAFPSLSSNIGIARSERSCREWRRILRSDDTGRAVWRKVAIRSSSQAAVDALAATFASHDEDGRVDFMRLAICLAKEPPQAKPPPTPTLRPSDIFCVCSFGGKVHRLRCRRQN